MISTNDQRVLFWDASANAFTDITIAVHDFDDNDEADITFDTGDYLYFGSYLPFNHKYFNFVTPNVVASSPSVEVWDGNEWSSVVDILDFTYLAGASFGKSGILEFTNDYDQNWLRVTRTSQEYAMTEFQNGPEIYWKYWTRVGFDANVSFSLGYVGNLFCNDRDLYGEYPALNQSVLLNSWQVGKTGWLKQEVLASEYIITDLKRRGIIIERSQVIERSTLLQAAVHKTANIIYSGLGPRNYAEEIALTKAKYDDAMDQNKFEQDENKSGLKEPFEQTITTHRATR